MANIKPRPRRRGIDGNRALVESIIEKITPIINESIRSANSRRPAKRDAIKESLRRDRLMSLNEYMESNSRRSRTGIYYMDIFDKEADNFDVIHVTTGRGRDYTEWDVTCVKEYDDTYDVLATVVHSNGSLGKGYFVELNIEKDIPLVGLENSIISALAEE